MSAVEVPPGNGSSFKDLAALALADGLKVFPCNLDKTPHKKVGRWSENATTDPATIESWSRHCHGGMVGVPTGDDQGVFVLDVDVKGGIDGFESLKALGLALPRTRTHRTKSGGGHLLFRPPPGEALGCTVGTLGPGLDTRGNGGYAIWAGSPGYEVVDDSPIADMPADLLALLKAAKPKKPKGQPPRLSLVKASPEAVWHAETLEARLSAMLGPMARLGFSQQAMEAAVRAEVPPERVPLALTLLPASSGHAVTVGEGGRNATLAKLAGVLRGAGWSHAGMLAALRVVNESFVPPLSPDEVATTVGSIARYPQGDIEPLPYDGGHFLLTDRGVTYQKDGETLSVCDPLRVVAMGRDASGKNWVRLCEWHDHDGKPQFDFVPAGELLKRNSELPSTLANQGLEIFNPALLPKYLAACKPDRRLLTTKSLGWHDARFVLPDETIGEGDAVIFQSDAAPAFDVSGTLDGWKESVGRLAIGNSRLLFAISAGLSAPLLKLAGDQGGGFHFRGDSSCGKSTALNVASSLWGDPESYGGNWNATGNGLEAVAAIHNDCLLVLDEGGVGDKTFGKSIYVLANGKGKARMSAGITVRKPLQWRLVFLSAGEVSPREMIERAGEKIKPGQEIRLADIEADAGKGLGLFEALHGLGSANEFAIAIGQAAARHHGTAGPAWSRHLVEAREAVSDLLSHRLQEIVALWASPSAEGPVLRVARRFALAAIAGELASEAGLTGWPAGEATSGVKACFDAWLAGFGSEGGIPREEQALLQHVRTFLERHGDSRFQPVARWEAPEGDEAEPENRYPVRNRVGFRERRADGRGVGYFVLASAMAEVCGTADVKRAVNVLEAQGWIARKEPGRVHGKKMVAGERFTGYFLTAKALEG